MHILSACFSISQRLSILAPKLVTLGSRGIVILPFWMDVATVSFFEIKSASVLDSLIHNLVTRALDTGKVVVGVYLDLRKAFDTVPHTPLMDKLHRMGIRGNLHCLIKIILRIEHNLLTIMAIPQKLNQSKLGSPRAQSWDPYFLSVS